MFGDKAMTVAAIDRLVHHAVILEMNADSYRRKAAITRMSDQAGTTNTTPQPADKKPNRRAPRQLNLASALNSLHASQRFRGDRQTGHPNCRRPAIVITDIFTGIGRTRPIGCS